MPHSSAYCAQQQQCSISRIVLFGERCSGTNYIKKVFEENFLDIEILDEYNDIYKHFFPLLDNEDPLNDSTLFVFILRNIKDWVQSFHLQPYHVYNKSQTFSSFIRSEWCCIYDQPQHEKYGYEMMCERNPATGQRFANIFQMREAKLRAYLAFTQKVSFSMILNYEKVAEFPEKIVYEIATACGITLKRPFQSNPFYKGYFGIPYIKKIYPALEGYDVKYIFNNINRELEKGFGYQYCQEGSNKF
jgi:hypothetical protein